MAPDRAQETSFWPSATLRLVQDASLAWFDWAGRLSDIPVRQAELVARAWSGAAQLATSLLAQEGSPAAPGAGPRPDDPRFAAPGWQRWPYDVVSRAFVLAEQWWEAATTDMPGISGGGHNAGIVSEPGHPHGSFQYAVRSPGAPYLDPVRWLADTPTQAGSWWTTWVQWLTARSSGRGSPPSLGAPADGYPPIADAPGSYVLER